MSPENVILEDRKGIITSQVLVEGTEQASSQIIQKKYDSQIRYEGYRTCIRYRMAFFDKRARIQRM